MTSQIVVCLWFFTRMTFLLTQTCDQFAAEPPRGIIAAQHTHLLSCAITNKLPYTCCVWTGVNCGTIILGYGFTTSSYIFFNGLLHFIHSKGLFLHLVS